MKHKIIFLDIDGVLNSDADFDEAVIQYDPVHANLIGKMERYKIINVSMLALLNDIVTLTAAKIVISSTWRNRNTPKEMHAIFQRYGNIWTHPKGTIIDSTPNLLRGMSDYHCYRRREEIMAWAKEHNCTYEDFIILDDMHQLFEWTNDKDDDAAFQSRLVYIANGVGLNSIYVAKAIDLLGKTPEASAAHEKEMQMLSMLV